MSKILEAVTDGLILVGTPMGEYAEELVPLFKNGISVGREDVSKYIDTVNIYLCSEYENPYDPVFCVAAFTENNKYLGHLWGQQSPTLHNYLVEHDEEPLRARVNYINGKARVLVAECDIDLEFDKSTRAENLNYDWAKDIPFVFTGLNTQISDITFSKLEKEIKNAFILDNNIQSEIDNVMDYLSSDLSSRRLSAILRIYSMMKNSDAVDIRSESDYVLKKLIHRDSEVSMRNWQENWLPNYMKEAEKSNLLRKFLYHDWTIEMVNELLKKSPNDLYFSYLEDKYKFAKNLYYSALPYDVYCRLLTLIAVRELMDKTHQTALPVEAYYGKVEEIIPRVQKYFWGSSSYAVVFCVLRDYTNYPDNASQFEREVRELKYYDDLEYACASGTISNTFISNPYMKFSVDKWDDHNIKDRVRKLRDAIIGAL